MNLSFKNKVPLVLTCSLSLLKHEKRPLASFWEQQLTSKIFEGLTINWDIEIVPTFFLSDTWRSSVNWLNSFNRIKHDNYFQCYRVDIKCRLSLFAFTSLFSFKVG